MAQFTLVKCISCLIFLSFLSKFDHKVLAEETGILQDPPLGQLSSTECNSKENCSQCIQNPECFWCSQPIFINTDESELPRCILKSAYSDILPPNLICEKKYLVSPENDLKYQSNKPLSGGYMPILIQPQGVDLKLRARDSLDLQVKFVQYENQPIDLYFLMDLSNSMEDDKDVLAGLGKDLTKSLEGITSDLQLGFGSFVDKVVMPITLTQPRWLLNPCGNQTCAAPYGFKNHLSLTKDTDRFFEKVRTAEISGNVDQPEGGFDGVMQVAVCVNTIGWRENARKIIIYSTDSTFHIAGDGKIGGIIRPNDGKCHLSGGGMYTHSSELDYPSISQLNSKVKENSINIIFAVTADHLETYENLSPLIQGSFAAKLEQDSSNLITLFEDKYKEISTNFEIKHNAPDYIRVTYWTKCDQNIPEQKGLCVNIPLGQTIEFTAKIELIECPKDPKDRKQNFEIYRVGVSQNLTVNIDLLCDCPCEKPGFVGYEENSEHCSGSGTFSCGICSCQSQFFGRTCECDGTQTFSLGLRGSNDNETSSPRKFDPTRGCRPQDSDIICSNRGSCECGKCECQVRANKQERISGKFCECDNFSCDRNREGIVCSGEEHGICNCGKCECHSGWGGNACECSTDNKSCYEPDSTEICSGRGSCVCGKCVCRTDSDIYRGKYCENCPTCPGRCEELKDCVQCSVHDQQRHISSCVLRCNRTEPNIDFVDTLNNLNPSEKYCVAEMKDPNQDAQCRFYFLYGYDPLGEMYIRAIRRADCPGKAPVFWIVFGVVVSIIVIGLVGVFAYKLYMHHKTGTEYRNFAKQKPEFAQNENPLYQKATSEFQNPAYGNR